MCKFILYRTENVSLNIAKWVYDIADCCYYDASCMLWLRKLKKIIIRGEEKEKHEELVVLYRLFISGKNYWK